MSAQGSPPWGAAGGFEGGEKVVLRGGRDRHACIVRLRTGRVYVGKRTDARAHFGSTCRWAPHATIRKASLESPARKDRLADAASVEDLVATVHDYVQALTRQEVDRLPRHHRPARIDGPEAIARWAEQFRLQEEAPANTDPVNSALFASVRDYFARAERRLAELS